MKTNRPRRKPASILNARWTAYAVAGAATASVGINCAEADIHYSGLVNVPFPPSRDRSKTLRLGDSDRGHLVFNHYLYVANSGTASLKILDCGASIRGAAFFSSTGYVSKLSFGQNISSGSFRISCSSTDRGILAVAGLKGYWMDPGIGFIGFRVDNGGGFQYGWIRVRMTGAPQNGFVLLDYAYADPGEPIQAGQTSSAEQARDQGSTDAHVPKEGSLGGLALGAVGLLAWRKSRSRAARLENT